MLQTFIKHNHMSVDPVGGQVKYDNRRRVFWVDLAIFFALVIVLLE